MTPTRRDVLLSLLGASGCSLLGGKRKPFPVGTVVGADVVLGHELKGNISIPDVNQPDESTDVVIVGGGISGLSSAWRLSQDGRLSFVLLELEPELGGNARFGTSPITSFPWGAHYVPVPHADNRVLIRLLSEMDELDLEQSERLGEPVGKETSLVAELEERVFYQGRWHAGLLPHAAMTPQDLEQLHRFHQEIDRWVAFRDASGRRAFTLPVANASDDAQVTSLDRISMAAWMDQRGLRSVPLRWLVDYSCRDDYGCGLEDTSAWAGIFYFAARVQQPGEKSQPFLTWPEGNGRIVRHLQSLVAHRARRQQLVVDVAPRKGGLWVTMLDGPSRTQHTICADHVVMAIPRFVQQRVIRSMRDRPRREPQFDTSPWLVANLTLRQRPRERGLPAAWDNVLYDSPSLGYVVATHQQGRCFGPTVWTYYYALTDSNPQRARQKLFDATKEEWVEVVLTDLSRAHPDLHECVQRVDLMRWGHAMIRPTPGFVWSEARRRAGESMENGKLHFAHTELSSVALVEESIHHGVRAAEKVLAARFEAVTSWF